MRSLSGWTSRRSARWAGVVAGGLAVGAVLFTGLQPAAQSGGVGVGSGAPVVPSVRILNGPAVTPSAAATAYGAGTTSTAGLCASAMNAAQFCSGGVVARAPELKALSRGLRADADTGTTAGAQETANRIYEYVRNTIDTEFLHGLHKGALGASIDHSGTAFDQAQLMVELLREAGITARYRSGTITLTAAQVTAWTGLSRASAVCALFATGGVPHQSAAGCGSGAVGSVTLSHVWVEADVGGASYVFDPAYKPYEHKAGLGRTALHAAMGLDAGEATTAAASGLSQGTQSGVPWVSGLNGSGVANQLQGYANGLLTRMGQADLQGADLGDVIGGREILPSVRPTGGWQQTAFAYASSASATWSGNIPNQYRATLALVATRAGTAVFSTTFYVDEIYGRRLELASRAVPNGAPVGNPPSQPYTYIPQIKLDGVVLAESTATTGTPVQLLDLEMTAGHPFAADSMAYGDSTVHKRANILLPVAIVHGWGQVSSALVAKWEEEQFEDSIAPETRTCNESAECEPPPPIPAGDLLRARMGASWLAQFSRAAELHAELADSRVTHHHSLGVVTGDYGTAYSAHMPPSPFPEPASPAGFSLLDETSVLDLETSFGLTSRQSNVLDRRAALHAVAASAAALEGSVVEQFTQTPDAVSTARRFAWGNAPESGETPSTASRRVYRYANSTAGGSAAALIVAENLATGRHATCSTCPSADPIDQGVLDQFRTRLSQAVVDYTQAGFDVTASSEALLGPGNRHGSEYLESVVEYVGENWTEYFYERLPSRQNGGALIANRYDANGDPLEIAHVLTRHSGRIKGGGGPSIQLHDVNAGAAADLMKDQFADRSAAAGVDLMSGRAGWSSPTLMSVGQGEFPYSLGTRVELRGDRASPTFQAPDSEPEPVRRGVVGSWDGSASISSSGLEAMGSSRIEAAAPTIAAFAALQDVYRAAPDTRREVIGALIADWWVSAIRFNVVSVSLGASTEQHVDTGAAWVPAAGGGSQLTVAGTPQLIREQFYPGPGAGNVYRDQEESITRIWKLDSLSFSLRGAEGDVRSYGHWALARTPYPPSLANRWTGFRLQTWSFPAGVTLTVNYPSAATAIPSTVSSNLGLSIAAFPTTGANGYQDAGARWHKATFAPDSVRSIGARPVQTLRVAATFQPGDLVTPAVRYTYGATNQIIQAEDAIAIRTPAERQPHRFFLAEGYRGERADPLNGRYAVESLRGGRITRHIDEMGRVTTTAHDGRGRITGRTMPWGDAYAFQYDARDNVTQMTHTPVADCTGGYWWCQTVTIQAQYHATWNKLTKLILPETLARPNQATWNSPASQNALIERTWDFSYDSTRGLLLTRTGPQVLNGLNGANARPVWTSTYDAYGRPVDTTDPTGLMTRQVWGGGGLPAWCLRTSTASQGALNLTTTFGCNAVGDVTSATDPRGNTSTTAYDALRRKTAETGPTGTGIQTQWVYDLNGNVTEERHWDSIAAAWRATTTTYSFTNQPRTVTDPSGDISRTCYDPLDRPSQTIDPAGRATLNDYNAAGQATAVRRFYRASSTSPTSCAVVAELPTGVTSHFWRRMEYNAGGLLSAEIDANNNRTELFYDGLGRHLRTLFADPDGSGPQVSPESWNVLDERGQVLQRRHRSGRYTDVFRDGLGRDFQVWEHDANQNWPVGRHVRASFDLASRPVWREVSHQTAATFDETLAREVRTYGYDAAGRVTQDQVKPLGSASSQTQLFTYGYDGASNRISITWPGSWTATYVYDAANRAQTVSFPTSAGTATANLSYDSQSRRTAITRQVGAVAGASTSYAYEPDGDLSSLIHGFVAGGQVPSAGFAYMYDAAGKVTLTGIDQPQLEWSQPAGSIAYGAPNGLNQLGSVNGHDLEFDTDGNLVADDEIGFSYAFDRANRLIAASGAGVAASYGYDSDDRRTVKTVNGLTTRMLWSGADEMAETSDSGVILRRFIPDGTGAMDGRLATVEGGVVSWHHTDRQGSVVAASGPTGRATRTTAYSPYGEIAAGTTPAGEPFGYTGRQFDPETGLMQYRARYYSSRLGQFLSTDPIGSKDDPNLMMYVGLDPVNKTDPTGKQACPPSSTNCVQATNANPNRTDRRTVTQTNAIDGAVISQASNYETTGIAERGARVDVRSPPSVHSDLEGDPNGAGPLVSEVPMTTILNGYVIESSMSGIARSNSVIHSHPTDESDPSPGPGDDAVVNINRPNNIVHDGNIIVVEKVDGQFRVRILVDANLTQADRSEIQSDVDIFQSRAN